MNLSRRDLFRFASSAGAAGALLRAQLVAAAQLPPIGSCGGSPIVAGAGAAAGGTLGIKSVQYGTVTIANAGTSATTTLSPAVDTANSVLVFAGNQGADSNNSVSLFMRLVLTNTNTVTGFRAFGVSGTATAGFYIWEFNPGVLVSLQVGTMVHTDGGASPVTTTLGTPVILANSMLFHSGQNASGSVSSGSADSSVLARLQLTGVTSVVANWQTTAGVGATAGFTVAEF